MTSKSQQPATTYQHGYGAVPSDVPFGDGTNTSTTSGAGSIPTHAAPPPSYLAHPDIEGAVAYDMKEPVIHSDVAVRMAFVRKVYSILAAQLGVTVIFSAFCLYSTAVKAVVQSNPYILFACALSGLGLLFPLMIYRRSYPTNMYLLSAFTFVEAYIVGVVCTLYESETVLQAAILTFVVFVALTCFTLQSKYDFSGMGPFLFGSLIILIFTGLLQIFFPFSRFWDVVIAAFGAIVFCGYIIFDTYMLFEKLSPEDYILASIELYLDIINLFMQILRLLGNSSD